MEKRKPERRDRTAAPRPAATPPAIRHRTATRPFRAEKMQLRRSKCTTYDDVAFNLPIVAFTLSGDPGNRKGRMSNCCTVIENALVVNKTTVPIISDLSKCGGCRGNGLRCARLCRPSASIRVLSREARKCAGEDKAYLRFMRRK